MMKKKEERTWILNETVKGVRFDKGKMRVLFLL
jgi:hypothetical protein